MHPCPHYLTPDDTHDLCIFCLGEEHARDVLEGAICVHFEFFSMRKLRSRLSLFSRKEGQPSASHGSGLTVAEAWRGMNSWGSQAELADELERGLSLSRSSAANESPSELFSTSVETVVEKFREAKARSAAFKSFIPRRSTSEPKQRKSPGPSPSGDQRWAQKASVAARAPPPPTGRGRGWRGSKRGRQDLREVIQTRRSQRSRPDRSKN